MPINSSFSPFLKGFPATERGILLRFIIVKILIRNLNKDGVDLIPIRFEVANRGDGKHFLNDSLAILSLNTN